MRHEAWQQCGDMPAGKLSSYFRKRRDAASDKEPEEGSDKRQTNSVSAQEQY